MARRLYEIEQHTHAFVYAALLHPAVVSLSCDKYTR